MKHALATFPLLLAACAPTITQEIPVREVEAGSEGACKPFAENRFVGQTATQALGAEILETTGAKTFQWVGPDTMVTMDFRPDRVRVSYDADLVVTSVRCG